MYLPPHTKKTIFSPNNPIFGLISFPSDLCLCKSGSASTKGWGERPHTPWYMLRELNLACTFYLHLHTRWFCLFVCLFRFLHAQVTPTQTQRIVMTNVTVYMAKDVAGNFSSLPCILLLYKSNPQYPPLALWLFMTQSCWPSFCAPAGEEMHHWELKESKVAPLIWDEEYIYF